MSPACTSVSFEPGISFSRLSFVRDRFGPTSTRVCHAVSFLFHAIRSVTPTALPMTRTWLGEST